MRCPARQRIHQGVLEGVAPVLQRAGDVRRRHDLVRCPSPPGAEAFRMIPNVRRSGARVAGVWGLVHEARIIRGTGEVWVGR